MKYPRSKKAMARFFQSVATRAPEENEYNITVIRKMSFGQKLERELKRHFYSQTELAKKSGISAMAINHFIHNRRQPSLANFSKLVRALPDTDARELLT